MVPSALRLVSSDLASTICAPPSLWALRVRVLAIASTLLVAVYLRMRFERKGSAPGSLLLHVEHSANWHLFHVLNEIVTLAIIGWLSILKNARSLLDDAVARAFFTVLRQIVDIRSHRFPPLSR